MDRSSPTKKDSFFQKFERMFISPKNPSAGNLISGQNENSACNLIISEQTDHDLIPSNRVDIKDLTQAVDKVMTGKYLLCTITAKCQQTAKCLNFFINDPEGKLATILCLCNYGNDQGLKDEDLFPIGTILAIKDPLFKPTDDGCHSVYCDNPANVVVIHDSMELGVTWKTTTSVRQDKEVERKSRANRLPFSEPQLETVDDFSSLGQHYLNERKYNLALRTFTNGLELYPNNVELLSNRCRLNIDFENFKEAMNDAEHVLQTHPNLELTIYYKTLCLLGLRQYVGAIDFLEGLNRKQKTKQLNSLKLKLTQQLRGEYDMKYFFDHEKDTTMKTYADCAEYHTKTKLVSTPGKGRGLLSDARVEAGQLIIASKAVALDDPNLPLDIYDGPNSNRLAFIITKVLAMYPEMRPPVYQLYAGPEMKSLDEQDNAELCAEMDKNRIQMICRFNAFQCDPLNSNGQPTVNGSSGLWIQPSLMNHMCVNYNALWFIKKNFLFVRAIKDIDINEEITIPYVSFFFSFEIRKETFLKGQFECWCELCSFERSEPDSVHREREEVLRRIKRIPHHSFLGRSQVRDLMSFCAQLESLRQNRRELNFPLVLPEMKLAFDLCKSRRILEAMKCFEKVYEITAPHAVGEAVQAAANLATASLMIADGIAVRKWIAIWKEQLRLVYGCDNIELFEDIKQRLRDHGFTF